METRTLVGLAGLGMLFKLTQERFDSRYLQNKTVLLTGEIEGLGVAVEKALIMDGAKVYTHPGNLNDPEEAGTIFQDVIDYFGGLDIIINTGIIEEETMETIIAFMREEGQGHIVNISSVEGKVSIPELRKDNIYTTNIVTCSTKPGAMNEDKVARKIITAIKGKKSFKVIGLEAMVGLAARVVPTSHRITGLQEH